MKIKKISDKNIVVVTKQENCTVNGKPHYYVKGQNCLYDCTAANKPRWYYSKHY